MRRYHVIVNGRVQAVGFRYTVTMLADRLGITGWVRNRYDGTVEMEIQGPDLTVEEFLGEVEAGPGFSEVEKVSAERLDLIDGEKSFDIKMDA
jgi:acylphosphatase